MTARVRASVPLTPTSLRRAQTHLRRACPVMAALIKHHGACPLAEGRPDAFETLATSIIGQQISLHAAEAIGRRVLALIGAFTPQQVLAASPDELRAAGLSAAKVRYLTELAQRVADGRLNLAALPQRSDAEVIAALVELPGIGQWTAEMFLMFGLKRPDVLSLGDAGLQRAARMLFGENVDLQQAGDPWRPWRSVASWYLWRALGAGGWPDVRRGSGGLRQSIRIHNKANDGNPA